MGRAMLIICSAVLISMGFISMGSSNQGRLLTEKTVNYADFTMAKNTAQTAIQMAMNEINKDEEFAERHDENNTNYVGPWEPVINGKQVSLKTEYDPHVDYWEPDRLRLISKVQFGKQEIEVVSLYDMSPFSTLVPAFESAVTIAADPDKYTFSANGDTSISGNSPTACKEDQESSMPGVAIQPGAEDNLTDLDKVDMDADPPYEVKEDLTYQPTDELIERLLNAPGATKLDGDVNDPLGSATNPGVFFVEDYLKLNGKQKEGYGILVIRSGAEMEYETDDGPTLDINGNFEWNGLIIFEDAYNFNGSGTPKINGSILVGHTADYNGDPIKIDITGNIHFQYDCMGEQYAQMAAADAVSQKRYVRIVTSEGIQQITN